MPPSGNGVVVGYSHANDPFHNPFASTSQTSFTSAIKPKEARVDARLSIRRRGSESVVQRTRTDHDPWQGTSTSSTASHARANTVEGLVRSNSLSKAHPLASSSKSPPAGNSSRSSLTDTRPRLKRMLSDLAPTPSGGSSRSSSVDPPARTKATEDRETMVVVHEVSPKDSLAGVALKYGISMAELRRANQLWTSDPIHLRKVLYIPVDKALKAKHLVLEHLETTSASASEAQLVDTSVSGDEDKRTHSSASTASLTIRRIPATQLSFFPPPSSGHLGDAKLAAGSRTLPRSHRSSARDPIPFELTHSTSSTYSETSGTSLPPSSAFANALQAQLPTNGTTSRSHIPTLTSLINSLPLPLGRLSFDSGTSTPTQASDEQEHELIDVRPLTKFDGSEGRSLNDPTIDDYLDSHSRSRSPGVVFKHSSPKPDLLELSPWPSAAPLRPTHSFRGADSAPHMPRKGSKRPGTAAYATPEQNTLLPDAVRTSQLEPSPTMQLPFAPRRDNSGVDRDGAQWQ